MEKARVEIVMNQIEWAIEDCIKEVERSKKGIEHELAYFNEVTSPMSIAQYGRDMEEATNRRKLFEAQKRQLTFLMAE